MNVHGTIARDLTFKDLYGEHYTDEVAAPFGTEVIILASSLTHYLVKFPVVHTLKLWELALRDARVPKSDVIVPRTFEIVYKYGFYDEPEDGPEFVVEVYEGMFSSVEDAHDCAVFDLLPDLKEMHKDSKITYMASLYIRDALTWEVVDQIYEGRIDE